MIYLVSILYLFLDVEHKIPPWLNGFVAGVAAAAAAANWLCCRRAAVAAAAAAGDRAWAAAAWAAAACAGLAELWELMTAWAAAWAAAAAKQRLARGSALFLHNFFHDLTPIKDVKSSDRRTSKRLTLAFRDHPVWIIDMCGPILPKLFEFHTLDKVPRGNY